MSICVVFQNGQMNESMPPEWDIYVFFFQNLKIRQYCQKTWKSYILKLLIFIESLIRSNFLNNDCMDILTRANDSPDYVAIHTYLIC